LDGTPCDPPSDGPIAADVAGTLRGLLAERVRRSPHAVAYREFDPALSAWRDHDWLSVARAVARLEAALCGAGLAEGDRVAIALPNGTRWVAFDMAAASRGLVVVPLYLRDSLDNQAFVLDHAGVRLLVIDSIARWEVLAAHGPRFAALDHVWLAQDPPDTMALPGRPAVRALSRTMPDSPQTPPPARGGPDRLATIIYTSGTTGRPKGVMLSDRALLANAEAVSRVVAPSQQDVFLSCLPLAHAFERVVGYYLPMMAGATVAYARSVDALVEDFRSIRPTAFLGVPRLYERAYAAIWTRARRSLLRRWLLAGAVEAGWQRFETRQGRRGAPAWPARLAWPLLDRLAGAPVRAAFGGRVRCAVSGGAALPVEVCRFFNALGVPVVEGYGLTEAGPVVAANGLEDNAPGTLGRPLPGVELRIADGGELLVRSPARMLGYWRDPQRTAQALDAGGWLHTGDIAEIAGGRVVLKGRTADVAALATGEKIAPAEIEARIARDPLFRQVFVVGEGRPFAVALVVLDRGQWAAAAAAGGIDPRDPNARTARALLLARIARALHGLPPFAQIRAVHARFDPWTIEAGQMTATLKLKRGRLAHDHAAAIERLYADHATVAGADRCP
jgi:long-chain acyl-CoA synthetase